MIKFMRIAGKERGKGILNDPEKRGGSGACLAAAGDGGAEG